MIRIFGEREMNGRPVIVGSHTASKWTALVQFRYFYNTIDESKACSLTCQIKKKHKHIQNKLVKAAWRICTMRLFYTFICFVDSIYWNSLVRINSTRNYLKYKWMWTVEDRMQMYAAFEGKAYRGSFDNFIMTITACLYARLDPIPC